MEARRLTRRLAAALALIGGIHLASPAFAAPALPATVNTPRTILIVANHTDDEMTLSALWANRPDIRKVVLWLNYTDSAANCTYDGDGSAVYPRADLRYEWRPSTPQSCATAHASASILNLNAIGRWDRTIPRFQLAPTNTWTETDGRIVRVWLDSESNRGALINVGLTSEAVTARTTRNMINDVTLHPTKYGLPRNTLWLDLIGSSYYGYTPNPTQCLTYQHSEHGRMHAGVRGYRFPQFHGWKYLATCATDPITKGTRVLPQNWVRIAYSNPPGTVNVYFGGLYRGTAPFTWTKSGVFSTTQAYWKGLP